jgi:AraC-like DNA-binding protein/mannose-6-phosphate isomerase-like protein (cupin superfamily)
VQYITANQQKGMSNQIPVYSLQAFSSPDRRSQQFHIEVFDANRHFQVMYPHRHDFFEVLFILKGSGVHVIDSNKYEITPPCMFFLSPGQAHKLELSHDIEGYIFIFTADFYQLDRSNPNRLIEFPFFYTIHQNNPPLRFENNDDVTFLEHIFRKGIALVANREIKNAELFRSFLDIILNFGANLYPVDENLLVKGKGHLLVKRFYQLLEEKHRENLNVNNYADLLSVTPNHLTQTLKQLTGKTSLEITKQKQLLEIKRLLVHTGMGVSEIANQMNFADQSYFTKFFKRETGMLPLAYRSASMK